MTHEFLTKLNHLCFEVWNDEQVRNSTEKVGDLSTLCETLMEIESFAKEDNAAKILRKDNQSVRYIARY